MRKSVSNQDPDAFDPEEKVLLLTSQEVSTGQMCEFKVTANDLRLSEMLSQLVSSLEPGDNRIPLPSVDAASLRRIVDFLRHHKGVKPDDILHPLRSTTMSDVCSAWDAAFIDLVDETGRQELYNLTAAAEYLLIPSLRDLCCAKIAALIKGKPTGQLHKILKPEKAGFSAREKGRKQTPIYQ